MKLTFHKENNFYYLRSTGSLEHKKVIKPSKYFKTIFHVLTEEELYDLRIQLKLRSDSIEIIQKDYFKDMLLNLRNVLTTEKNIIEKNKYNEKYKHHFEQKRILEDNLRKLSRYSNKETILAFMNAYKNNDLSFMDIPPLEWFTKIKASEILNCFTEEFLKLSRESLIENIKTEQYGFIMDI